MALGEVYRGREEPAGVLKRMIQDGRAPSSRQRQRWQRNRMMYRGDQWLRTMAGANQVRSIERDTLIRGQRRRDVHNRLRKMVDGRVAMLTAKRADFEVVPPRRDQDLLDAARMATRVIQSKWNELNLQKKVRELERFAEIDGISYLSVIYDSQRGKRVDIPIDPNGQPVTNPAALEGWRIAGMLQYQTVQLGEVAVRVILANELAIDPNTRRDWNDCKWVIESRLRSRHDVEALLGQKLEDAAKRSQQVTRRSGEPVTTITATVEDAGTTRAMAKHEALTHTAFILPHGDWPKGAHIEWYDGAPAFPWISEPWEDDLPYYAYAPRPDTGNLVESQGTVDMIESIQRRHNRMLSLGHEWAENAARPPVGIPIGSMRSDSIYTEKGHFDYHAQLGKPEYMHVPTEPVQLMTSQLDWHANEMAEMSDMADPARGFAPGHGVESAAALSGMVQQVEIMMSEAEAELKSAIEWLGTRLLVLMGRHYIVPRQISMSGVDDSGEYFSFRGEMLRGVSDFRVSESLLPKNRAQMTMALMQFAPVLGAAIRPWLGKIIEGDISEFLAAEDRQRQKQRRENRRIAALAGDDRCQQIWRDFEFAKGQYAEALQVAAQQAQIETQQAQGMAEPGMAPPPAATPQSFLAARGIQPPKLTNMLREIGADVPTVEDFDNHALHILDLDDWRVGDGFEELAKQFPWIAQIAREHGDDHKGGMAEQMGAIAPPMAAGPEGSSPKELGTPSPPKMNGKTEAPANLPAPPQGALAG